MAKEIVAYVKLQVQGGAAAPSGAIGPALGSKGVNIMEFCKQFNARTQDKKGELLPVLLTIYSNKSFDFIIKTPPAPSLLIRKAKIAKGSAEPNRKKVGQVTWEDIVDIANLKMPDLNAFALPAAARMIAGTARSMGLNVTGENPFEQLNTVSHG